MLLWRKRFDGRTTTTTTTTTTSTSSSSSLLLLLSLSLSLSLLVKPTEGQSDDGGLRFYERDHLMKIYEKTRGDQWTRNKGWGNFDVDYCEWYGVVCRNDKRASELTKQQGDVNDNDNDNDEARRRRRRRRRRQLLDGGSETDFGEGDNKYDDVGSAAQQDETETETATEGALDDFDDAGQDKTNEDDYDDNAQPETKDGDDFDDGADDYDDNQAVEDDGSTDQPWVVALDLSDNNLNGRTGREMFQFPILQTLLLDDNPNLDFSFDHVEKAQILSRIQVYNTGTSSLRGLDGAADALETLQIGQIDFGGIAIPSEIFSLTNLKELYMKECNFEGTLSTKIGLLSNLEIFNLYQNSLTGAIPSEMGQLKELFILTLSRNRFDGTLPIELNGLSKMQRLYMENNYLKGPLLDFEIMPNLTQLYLNYNSLTGPIPDGFIASTFQTDAKDVRVNLAGNWLTGTVPASLDYLKNIPLRILLTDNAFVAIDPSLCDNENWLKGAATNDWQCDAIMCPVGTYNEKGRRMEGQPCVPCSSSQYMGATYCDDAASRGDTLSILTDLFQATSGGAWGRSDSWLDTATNACDWYGIVCHDNNEDDDKNGEVKAIQLDNNNLYGTIPKSVWKLPYLEEVTVSRNEIGIDLTNIGSAQHLAVLDIHKTMVAMLHGIGDVGNSLIRLVVDKTEIGGKIPDDFYQLTRLRYLSMAQCGLSGKLQDALGDMTELRELFLYGNNLSGQIPETIGNLQEIRTISLSRNSFTGSLPDSLSSLTKLKALSLSQQRYAGGPGITGPLPTFAENTELFMISLGGNILQGDIPYDFLDGRDTDATYTIDLSSNKLTGTVPESLARFDNMDIYLEDNMFVRVPRPLCNKESWLGGNVGDFGCDAILCPFGTVSLNGRREYETLKCQDCTDDNSQIYIGRTTCGEEPVFLSERDSLIIFFGELMGSAWTKNDGWTQDDVDVCDWYGVECNDFGSVVSIILGSNNLVGTVPHEVFDLVNLQKLSLHSNPNLILSFQEIGRARKLATLHLDTTGLTSLAGIGQARNLKGLDVRFNNLQGRFPTELYGLTQMRDLLLSDNKFSGPLPTGLGKMSKLSALLLGNNQFTGTLVDFADLNRLVFLDVSHNLLRGPVPPTLLKSVVPDNDDDVIFVDFSANQLTGTLPGALQRLPNVQLHAKDNRLTGIDAELCGLQSWNKGSVEEYGCDGILCPIGTFNEIGRQSSDDTPCQPCTYSKHMGSAQCVEGMNSSSSSSSPSLSPFRVRSSTWVVATISTTTTVVALGLSLLIMW